MQGKFLSFQGDGGLKLPADFKRILFTVLCTGIMAYGFSMSNLLLGQDNSYIWLNNFQSLSDILGGAAAGRWLCVPVMVLFGKVNMPWWDGLWALLLIALAAFVTCRLFEIRSGLLQIVLGAVMTACPAAVSSFNYLSSTPVYMLALLAACLAPYFLFKVKYGFVPALICMLVTDAVYTAYISVTACWVVLYALEQIVQKKKRLLSIFLQELQAAVLAVFSLAGTLLISQAITALLDLDFQQRVTSAAAMGAGDYIQQIGTMYWTVLHRVFSNWTLSYMKGLPYFSLRAAVLLGVVCAFLLLWKRELWREPPALVLAAVNVLVLPLTMDVLGIITRSHSLMTYAYITPLVASVLALSLALEHKVLPQKWLFQTLLPLLLVAANTAYTLYFVQLANIDASFRFSQYESAVQLTTRVIDRIEAQDGYIPGETPVLFAGKFPQNYYYTEGEWALSSAEPFFALQHMEGANAWMAFTYQELFEYFADQVIGTEFTLAGGGGGTDFTTDIDRLLSRAQAADETVTAGMLADALQSCSEFPAQDCCVWLNDILVVKLDLSDAAAAL